MPDLLLELFSEEIPARMQARGAEDLRRLITDGLVAAGLTYEGAKAFATPRRLALTVHGVTARSADMREERKGPRVGAPSQALEGFLRGAGLASIDEAQIQSDPKKGDFYVATVTRPGRAAEDIIAELVARVIGDFPWPKSMRWGERSAPLDLASGAGEGASTLRWVRPLRSILCTFGPETEEPVVVPIEVAGIVAGNLTYGHRFMAGGQPIRVRRFDDYVPALERAKVVLDPERRRNIIETEARNLAFAQGLELVDDPGLLEEVAGLVEWPVVLMGAFDPEFLEIPDEVIRLTIRANQKCFVLRDPSRPPAATPQDEGARPSALPHGEVRAQSASLEPSKHEGPARLTNRFILTANIEASDGGEAIVAGNERVIAARLSDARFFWEGDKAVPLESWAEKLGSVTFHEKLGTQAERVERIARLARELAPLVGADPDDAERAARLAKADLTTGMVGEFPELQGVMGRYYALAQGEKPAIADAVSDHYKPQGPGDSVPTEPVAIAVALADKLDTLVSFWAIDEKPTGSKDPYALRRAALGVIRIVLGNQLRISLSQLYREAIGNILQTSAVHFDVYWMLPDGKPLRTYYRLRNETESAIRSRVGPIAIPGGKGIAFKAVLIGEKTSDVVAHQEGTPFPLQGRVSFEFDSREQLHSDLLAFFADRLKVHLRENGAGHDLIDAVLSAGASRALSSPLWGEAESRKRPGEGAASPIRGAAAPSPASGLRSESASPQRGEEANDDLLMIVRRVEALGQFLDSEDGKNLLVGYRRAANILRAEEKKDGEGAFTGPPDADLIAARGGPEEQALFQVMQAAEARARDAVAAEDFGAAMGALAELRPAVDAFFDKVTVNAEDPELRANRLKLLNMLRQATLAVADFSKIGG